MGGGSDHTAKLAALEGEGGDPEQVLKDYFHNTPTADIIGDIAIKDTLGHGTYGRVRLCESAGARDALERVQLAHTGFFALKILKKSEIIRLKQGEHVQSERQLLLHKTSHPFIVQAYHTYKDERNLFMILEYVPGGELLSDARNCFDNDTAKFYAAQLVMALQYLHADNIIYRGLVPDNLLIDRSGYIKLVDFGFAKQLHATTAGEGPLTYTLCGTAEYLAPEIVNSQGHSKGADWWALGIVIYEMLAGYPPFYANNPFEIYQQILRAQPRYPLHFDLNLHEGINIADGARLRDQPRNGLVARLLISDRKGRIGCLKNGAEDIKKHKWFRGLNWAQLYNKQMAAPMTPDLASDADTRYYANYPDSVEESGPLLTPQKQKMFDFWC